MRVLFRTNAKASENPSQEHFFARAIAFEQMADELQRIAAHEHRPRQGPRNGSNKQQYARRDDEACGNPEHVQPEARGVSVPAEPVFDGFQHAESPFYPPAASRTFSPQTISMMVFSTMPRKKSSVRMTMQLATKLSVQARPTPAAPGSERNPL